MILHLLSIYSKLVKKNRDVLEKDLCRSLWAVSYWRQTDTCVVGFFFVSLTVMLAFSSVVKYSGSTLGISKKSYLW